MCCVSPVPCHISCITNVTATDPPPPPPANSPTMQSRLVYYEPKKKVSFVKPFRTKIVLYLANISNTDGVAQHRGQFRANQLKHQNAA